MFRLGIVFTAFICTLGKILNCVDHIEDGCHLSVALLNVADFYRPLKTGLWIHENPNGTKMLVAKDIFFLEKGMQS